MRWRRHTGQDRTTLKGFVLSCPGTDKADKPDKSSLSHLSMLSTEVTNP